ncbi:hypothetical protein BGW80DRAFT_1256780 [Lactifluus volemus]|nr:hypothetical protein BGW80DRAFT_1256780 [Lactifluus volemus]
MDMSNLRVYLGDPIANESKRVFEAFSVWSAERSTYTTNSSQRWKTGSRPRSCGITEGTGDTQLVVKHEADDFRGHYSQARKDNPLSRILPHSNVLLAVSTRDCHVDHVTTNLRSPMFQHEAFLCATPNSRDTWTNLGRPFADVTVLTQVKFPLIITAQYFSKRDQSDCTAFFPPGIFAIPNSGLQNFPGIRPIASFTGQGRG